MKIKATKHSLNLFKTISILLIQAILLTDVIGLGDNSFSKPSSLDCSTLAPQVNISAVNFQNACLSLGTKNYLEEISLDIRPEIGQLRYLGRAIIGGEKNKEFWVDLKTGRLWIFKINPYVYQSYRPLGVETYYKFMSRYFRSNLEGFALNLKNRNGTLEAALLAPEAAGINWAGMSEEAVSRNFKKFALPNAKRFLNDGSISFESLSEKQINSLLEQMVIDWLFSNHDAHPANFVVDKDGNIIGIDKEQVFKYFPNDILSLNYLPNGESFRPLYNNLIASLSVKNKLDIGLLKGVIDGINNIPEEELRELLMSFALAYAKQNPERFATAEDFISAFLERKNNLTNDFKVFFSGINLSFLKLVPEIISQLKTPEFVNLETAFKKNVPDFKKSYINLETGVKINTPKIEIKDSFIKEYGSFLNIDLEGFKSQAPIAATVTAQHEKFNQQAEMNRELAAMYGLSPEFLQRIRAMGDDPEAAAALIDEKFNELISQAQGDQAQKLQQMRAQIKGKIRSPTLMDLNLKMVLRLLTSWISRLRQQKSDFHRVYLARDGGFFYGVDRALEDLSGKVSEYDKGSSVYHLSRSRMKWEVNAKMRRIIEDSKMKSRDDISLLYRNIRKRFLESYAEDAVFRNIVDSVREELLALGYGQMNKIIFADTGYIGSIPFFLKNVMDIGKNEEELLDETGEELIQVALVQPSSISGFARALFGFDLGLLDSSEQQLVMHLAEKFDNGKSVGDHLEAINAHPVFFNENSQMIEKTDLSTHLELFYEQIIAAQMVVAFDERRSGVAEFTNSLPPDMQQLLMTLMDKKDFIQFIDGEKNNFPKIDNDILQEIKNFKIKTDFDIKKFVEVIDASSIGDIKISDKVIQQIKNANVKNIILEKQVVKVNINKFIFGVARNRFIPEFLKPMIFAGYRVFSNLKSLTISKVSKMFTGKSGFAKKIFFLFLAIQTAELLWPFVAKGAAVSSAMMPGLSVASALPVAAPVLAIIVISAFIRAVANFEDINLRLHFMAILRNERLQQFIKSDEVNNIKSEVNDTVNPVGGGQANPLSASALSLRRGFIDAGNLSDLSAPNHILNLQIESSI